MSIRELEKRLAELQKAMAIEFRASQATAKRVLELKDEIQRLREARSHIRVTKDGERPDGRRRLKIPDAYPSLIAILGYRETKWSPLPIEERKVHVRVEQDPATGLYVRTLTKDGEVIEVEESKPYQKARIGLSLQRLDGSKIRIPWREIDSGVSWSCEIALSDYFFRNSARDRHREWVDSENAKRRAVLR